MAIAFAGRVRAHNAETGDPFQPIERDFAYKSNWKVQTDQSLPRKPDVVAVMAPVSFKTQATVARL
jgi:hypothetical protein